MSESYQAQLGVPVPPPPELSPAAQAVMDATLPVYDEEALYVVNSKQHAGMIAAAALRAAAAHTRRDRICQTMGWAVKGQEYCLIADIEAIAAELDGTSRP